MVQGVSDSQMYEEIMEVVNKLRFSDKALQFLEDIEGRVEEDTLTEGQHDFLASLYTQACDSPH